LLAINGIRSAPDRQLVGSAARGTVLRPIAEFLSRRPG
jgi:hypothetical protein